MTVGVADGYDPSRLQFVVDALRTTTSTPPLDLTQNSHRARMATDQDVSRKSSRPAVRNGDGTALTVAQIATAANLTVAQITDIFGRL
jgi:hypothetical protein